MAGALKIKAGTKLYLAVDVPVGQEPNFSMLSTFSKNLDESSFLVSVPMKDGALVKVDETQKLLIRYTEGSESVILAGYVDDVVKEKLRSFWKIRRVVEQRQFFVRKDERVKINLPVTYLQDTWPVNIDGVIEPEAASSLDISAGGIALFLNRHFEVGEICMIHLPDIGTTSLGKAPADVVGVICWEREAPKGSPYRMICGLQYRFSDGADRKKMENYVNYVKRRYKL